MEGMSMNTSTRAQRKVDLGHLLLEPSPLDVQIAEHHLADFIAGTDHTADHMEFMEHECWRMLFVFPDEADPSMPGRVECTGCGMVGRFEVEYKP
jgi:hypothetical protein